VPLLLQCLQDWLMALPLNNWASLGIRPDAVLGTLELVLLGAASTQGAAGGPGWAQAKNLLHLGDIALLRGVARRASQKGHGGDKDKAGADAALAPAGGAAGSAAAGSAGRDDAGTGPPSPRGAAASPVTAGAAGGGEAPPAATAVFSGRHRAVSFSGRAAAAAISAITGAVAVAKNVAVNVAEGAVSAAGSAAGTPATAAPPPAAGAAADAAGAAGAGADGPGDAGSLAIVRDAITDAAVHVLTHLLHHANNFPPFAGPEYIARYGRPARLRQTHLTAR